MLCCVDYRLNYIGDTPLEKDLQQRSTLRALQTALKSYIEDEEKRTLPKECQICFTVPLDSLFGVLMCGHAYYCVPCLTKLRNPATGCISCPTPNCGQLHTLAFVPKLYSHAPAAKFTSLRDYLVLANVANFISLDLNGM